LKESFDENKLFPRVYRDDFANHSHRRSLRFLDGSMVLYLPTKLHHSIASSIRFS